MRIDGVDEDMVPYGESHMKQRARARAPLAQSLLASHLRLTNQVATGGLRVASLAKQRLFSAASPRQWQLGREEWSGTGWQAGRIR